VAIDRYGHGDTAGGIPILQRKLLDGRFTLPERPGVGVLVDEGRLAKYRLDK